MAKVCSEKEDVFFFFLFGYHLSLPFRFGVAFLHKLLALFLLSLGFEVQQVSFSTHLAS